MFFRFAIFAVVFLAVRILTRLSQDPEPEEGDEFESYHQISEVPADQTLHKFLVSSFSYYTLLSVSEQFMFRRRMALLLKSKWFAGSNGLQVSDAMILLIVATMAQITFGLNRFYFPLFQRIMVFPDIFYSRLFERDVKGLTVFHSGAIFISWPHFQHGVEVANDKVNLGLHEFAHALYLDYFEHRNMRNGFARWSKIAEPVLEKMKLDDGHSFLRKYASENIHEFWAVSVEHFFEAPLEFEREIPELYLATSKVLKQDLAERMRLNGIFS
jgi:MtfA peptidase